MNRPKTLLSSLLAGLVIHGNWQGWWIGPVLSRLDELPLFVGAVALTAFNDNALITYLATLVPDLSDPTLESALHAKYDYTVNAAGVDQALERAQRNRTVADSTKAAQQPPSAVPLPGQPGAAPAAPAPAPDTTKKP